MTTICSSQWLFLLAINIWLMFVVEGTAVSSNDLSMDDCNDTTVIHYQRLHDKYEMRYYVNETTQEIKMCLRTKTLGYIGIGFSPKGKMQDSDIAIGWVRNNTAHLVDLHGVGNTKPKEDISTDWHLLMGWENNGFTTLLLKRKLDTCDKEDLKIGSDTVKVIYSFHDDDPVDGITSNWADKTVKYHTYGQRGVVPMLPMYPPPKSVALDDLKKDDNGVKVLNLTMKNYTVPSNKTHYACVILDLPADVKMKTHHIVGYEPIVDKGRIALIHHIVVYNCVGKDDQADVGIQHTCFNNRPPDAMICEKDVFLVWAVGGRSYQFPKHVGQPLGGDKSSHYFKLEVHYDNINDQFTGVEDNSGFRLFITPNLRPFDAGLWQFGTRITNSHVIPPHFPSLITRGYCRSGCFEQYYDEQNIDEVTVIGAMLHTHLAGRKITSRIIRNGKELPPMFEDNHYDFDYQEMRALREENYLKIKRGDTIVTHCIYETLDRTKVTMAGFPTDNEMCFVYMLYYPMLNLTSCESDYRWEGIDTDDFKDPTKYDWTNETVRMNFQKDQDKLNITHFCYGITPDKAFNGTERSQIILPVPYKHPDNCKKDTKAEAGIIAK